MNTAYPPLRPVEPRPPILPSQSLHQDDQRSPTSYRLPSAIPLSSQNGISAHLPISSSNANNAEAGPSNSSVSVNTLSSTTTNTKKRVGVANARKRQRAAAFGDVIGSGTGPTGTGGLGAGNGGGPTGVGIEDAGRPPAKQRESPKKKKAQRACAHCQKAHLTCDDNRPCTRCVKRNMAEKCIEGHRKKAKYLLDDAELEALKKGKSAPTESSETPQSIPSSVVDQFPTNDLYFNLPLDQTYSFGSEAANLEYSSLSAILGLNNYSPEQPFLTETPPGSSSTGTVGSVSAVGYVPVPSSGGVGMGGANGMNGSSVNGGGGNTGGGGPTQFANAAWPSEPQTNISPQALLGGQSIVGYEYGGNASAHHQQQAQQYQRQQQQQQQQQQQDGPNGNGYGGGGGGQGGMYDSVSISMQNGRHQQGLTVRSMSSDGSGGNLAFGSQDPTFSQRQQQQSQGQGQSPSQNQSQGGSQQQQQQQAVQQSYLGPSRSMSLPTVPSQQQQQQQQQQQIGQSVVNSPSTSLANGVGGSGSGSVRGSFASLNGTTPPMSSGDSPMSAGAGGSNVSVNGYGGEGTLVGGMVVNNNGVVSAGVGSGLENGNPALGQGDSALDVYTNVTKPYSYIESYQFLMKFLNKSFQKNDILRVIRALAIYRPSMIALQAPMTEDDFVFMEKCLRRTCIELEKLISYTGTPTVVWRRTGEICLVGVEFCLLTEWKKEELVTGRKYIYELFESQSVIEYWENFASHAFENTTQSVFSHCVLLKPGGEPIPCTFCFSIRRDIFDMPSVVIGQWLPLM